MRDSLLLQEKYNISIVTKDESLQEFQQFGSDLEIDFQHYQVEDKQVRLLQRFKAFISESFALDDSVMQEAIAFCSAIR